MTTVDDLRSDTATRPDAEMRGVMAAAAVGDDGYHDDPTVRSLEERTASLFGMDAAIFVPSGTFANQLLVRTRCRPGDAIAAPPACHLQVHEGANAAATSGAQIMPIGTPRGFVADEFEALLAEEACGWPRVALCWLENSLATPGGAVWPIRSMRAVADRARAHGRPIHLDGSRLWNTHVATGVALRDWSACTDTLSVCFSKGLGAPVGSMLCGPANVIDHARRLRYGMGGTMRQSGILAAAATLALDRGFDHLAEDHTRAARLARGLAAIEGWRVLPPETNVVLCRTPGRDAARLCADLAESGVLTKPNRPDEVRFVLHRDVDDAAVDRVLERVGAVLS